MYQHQNQPPTQSQPSSWSDPSHISYSITHSDCVTLVRTQTHTRTHAHTIAIIARHALAWIPLMRAGVVFTHRRTTNVERRCRRWHGQSSKSRRETHKRSAANSFVLDAYFIQLEFGFFSHAFSIHKHNAMCCDCITTRRAERTTVCVGSGNNVLTKTLENAFWVSVAQSGYRSYIRP